MRIPKSNLIGFVREITNQCFTSRHDRINRGGFFQSYYDAGSNDPSNPALFNKTYASMDDLESLLYSPVSLRFKISDPDLPGVLSQQKGRVAAARLRNAARRSDTDTMISMAVQKALIKGKSFIKQLIKDKEFSPTLVQPEDMGVLRENYGNLDQNMEAFSHRTMVSIWQFDRQLRSLGWSEKDQNETYEKAKNFQKLSTGDEASKSASMQVTVGGMYPFQPSNNGPAQARGIADWLSQPKPSLSPEVEQYLLPMDETWIWDDDRDDWATFQTIGEDILTLGRFQKINALAYDAVAKQSSEFLKGEHPFREFCINPVDDYFWGRSELTQIVTLQELINSRIVGINKMLRKQEAPTRQFIGTTGVNQNALSRYDKPNGYFVDGNPNTKINIDKVDIPQDLFNSLHEYERMFDDMMGLPPTARGKGDSGVRSHRHAQTLVQQSSPRFKDRALLVERDVEALAGLMLDLKRAHDDHKMIAWVPEQEAGLEGMAADALAPPPAPGMVPVPFRFSDLSDTMSITVDSHSSSPAFAEDEKQLNFDLVKIGAESKEDLVEHVDVSDPEALQMGIIRRDIAAAKAKQEEEQAKLAAKGAKH